MFTLDDQGRVPAAQQSRVSAFLSSAHGALARRLGMMVPGPLHDGAALALHAGYYGELELVSLLARATRWTVDLDLPLRLMRWEAAWLPAPVTPAGSPLEDISIDLGAFGHALLGGIRPATLLPPEHAADDPFALALRTLEVESGRLIQVPIAILRSPALAHRSEAVEAAVAARHATVRGLWQAMLEEILV